MKIHPTKPKLCHFNYDTSKTWFVYFRYLNPNTGKREVHKKTFDINRIPDKHERARHGRAMAKAMWEEIQMGWLPIEEKQGIFKINTLLESMEEVTAVAWAGKRPRTIHSYTIVKRMFFEWMHKVRLDLIKPKEFNTIYANKYMDHIKIEKRMTGRTWNNHLGYIKIFFNYLVEREIIDKNPFRAIKKQPELKSTKNIAYTEQEQAILNDYLYKHHRPLYHFCRMIYGLYLRPAEISRIKISDVDLHNWIVNLRPENAKTKSYRAAIIPDSFRPMFEEMNLSQYPKDYYLFSIGTVPGPEYNPSFDKLTPKLKKINLKLGINPECTIYSWRHSGVIKLYKILNHDIYQCMQITGHTEIKTFQNYLKSLGFVQDNGFRGLMV